MTVFFLAPVGSRDVELSDPSLLPSALQHEPPAPRPLGEEILADFGRYADALRLPLIDVSLHWLIARGDVAPDELSVHLFASDQHPPPTTPEPRGQGDSILLAQIVERQLRTRGVPSPSESKRVGRARDDGRRTRLRGSQIHVHPLRDDPADYGLMLNAYSQELAALEDQISLGDRVYLEVTGGTTAMSSMLLVAGVETFGHRVHTLYVRPGADRPHVVPIGPRFFARQAQLVLQEQLRRFAYAAARTSVDRRGELIAPDVADQTLLRALLDYADRRLAFDFAKAREALHRASAYASGRLQAHVRFRQRELARRDSAALLAELIHSMRIMYQLGQHADFVHRLLRFREGCFRHLAEGMGLRYRKGDERYADPDWVDQVVGLRAFLEDYTSPVGDRHGRIRLSDRPLTVVSLGAIVDFFVARGKPWGRLQAPVSALHRLSTVTDLHSQGLVGPGFDGISRADLEHGFGQDLDHIVPLLEEIYGALFTAELGDNPYEALNGLILSLLRR